ncbi:hypothetical protein MRB53_036272 [Persea americana]|nr:hypothetical protein MRB53_036450 [Persea americana]KAJ8614859.1 hypothetical protein MRB53_036272 [Persea americana]
MIRWTTGSKPGLHLQIPPFTNTIRSSRKKATILRPMMSSAYAPRPAQQKQKIVTHRPKVERANPVDPTARLTRSDNYSLQKRVAYFPEKPPSDEQSSSSSLSQINRHEQAKAKFG